MPPVQNRVWQAEDVQILQRILEALPLRKFKPERVVEQALHYLNSPDEWKVYDPGQTYAGPEDHFQRTVTRGRGKTVLIRIAVRTSANIATVFHYNEFQLG